jgi:hypothetical protein
MVERVAGASSRGRWVLVRLLGWIATRLGALHWSINLLLLVAAVAVFAWLSRGMPTRSGGYATFGGTLLAMFGAFAIVAVLARVVAVASVRKLHNPSEAHHVWTSQLTTIEAPDDVWSRVRSFADTMSDVDNIDDEARWLTWWTASWLRTARFWIRVVDRGSGSEVVTYCAGFFAGFSLDVVDLNDEAEHTHDRLKTVLQSP